MDKVLEQIIHEVGQKPIRSSIITAAALIDSMLKKLLQSYLVDDTSEEIFKGQGCLSTFSSKIKMTYALGLISHELYQDMNSFREIRNRCAHDLIIGDDVLDSIKARANNFNLLNRVFSNVSGEDLIIQTSLEFFLIISCLLKRINNIERITPFPFEAQDNYLGFDDKDYAFFENFSKIIKK